MNWKIICEVGIKILAAAVAGTVVFVGISNSKTDQKGGNKDLSNSAPPTTGEQPSQEENVVPVSVQEKQNEPTILSSLRATQDGFGKLLVFVQSLTMVAENLARIFGSNSGNYGGYYFSQPYYNDPWSFRQPVNAGGQTWTRISPFIIEAGPTNPNCRSYYAPF